MNLDNNVIKVFEKIENMCGNSPDITKRIFKYKNINIGYIYFDSTSSGEKITDSLLKSLTINLKYKNIYKEIISNLNTIIPGSNYKYTSNYKDLVYFLSSGFVAIIVDGYDEAIVIEVRNNLNRSITESSTETIIRGPKDSFTENYNTNIGLIRKRIKDENLWIKEVKVGRRSKSKVGVIYINDIADNEKVNKIYEKIKSIDIDAILDSGYIRDFLTKDSKSFFPLVISTERPDVVSGAILEGKIAIMVENSPFVLILPALLIDFIHAPEDYYDKPVNVTFSRLLRFLAFILTIVTPAIYIAITTFNIEIVPDTLLISIAVQREGVPFPTTLEILLLVTTFELLKESDVRTPSVIGTSISIVGALVLGEAAVNAGVVSSIAVIITAITSISSLLFSDIDIINSYRWWRLIFILFASFLGLPGFIIAFLIFIIKLSSLSSLDIPYLTPISPLNKNDVKDTFVAKSRAKMFRRPSFLTKNKRRLK